MDTQRSSEDISGGAVAAQMSPETPTVLWNIQSLVGDKTRFEPEDIHAIAAEDADQGFLLEARHQLIARVEQRDINGFFKRQAEDHRCSDPRASAEAEIQARLSLASDQLQSQLQMPGTAYNEIVEGIFLPHDKKHWHLHDCSGCGGVGRIDCHTCYGKKRETCWRCTGGASIACDAWSCFGGRVNCIGCAGTGQTSQVVSYQVANTVWVNGYARTDYQTHHRTEYRTCTAYGCMGGKVLCGRCAGTGAIYCPTCSATGQIVCRTCHGDGDLRCDPCEGSGQLGSAAWVDVHDVPEYEITLSEDASDDARAILEKEGVHGVASVAAELDFSRGWVHLHEQPLLLLAEYLGRFRISHLTAACNGHEYHLVAYGNDLRWLSLNGIIERLLRNDLEALRAALSEAADEGIFSRRVDHLLEALKAVSASELNAELVEVALGIRKSDQHEVIVSSDYSRNVQTCILGSLRYIYTRAAKGFWWKAALAAAVVVVSVWMFSTLFLAGLAGLSTVPVGLLVFRRNVKKLLSQALVSAAHVDRSMTIATVGKRQQVATMIVAVPAAVAAVAFATLLPSHEQEVISARNDQATAIISKSPEKSVTTPTAVTIESAHALFGQGQFETARAQFRELAESGNRAAFGPYSWIVINGYGLPKGMLPEPAVRGAEADTWIEKGMAVGDSWAQAAKGEMLAYGWGAPRNTPMGLSLLKQAASAGHAEAMHILGLIYVQGLNVPRNTIEARKWFTMAADKGQPGDIYNVGLMDWNGEGISRPNRKRAMELWKQAADMGESRAIQAIAKERPH